MIVDSTMISKSKYLTGLQCLKLLWYESMAIADGGAASLEYLRVTFGGIDEAQREAVRRNLEQYCELDTMAMVEIVGRLRGLVR